MSGSEQVDDRENGWDLLVDGLLRTDFARAVDGRALIDAATARARAHQRRLIVALWAAVLLLSLGFCFLGARLGSATALQRECLARLEVSAVLSPPAAGAIREGDRP